MMRVFLVSPITVSAMPSRLTAMARPPIAMPPVLMRGEATQMSRSSGENRLQAGGGHHTPLVYRRCP